VPSRSALAPALTAHFDASFTQRNSFASLDRTLKRLHVHKEESLLLLERPPDSVLQTNGSDGEIRSHVKWRTISGVTRSELGKRCRDGFASLTKTCRRLGIIREGAAAASAVPWRSWKSRRGDTTNHGNKEKDFKRDRKRLGVLLHTQRSDPAGLADR